MRKARQSALEAQGWVVGTAKRLHSSQSRVAKMEAGDASVSFDLLVRALVRLGATTADIARAIQTTKRRKAA